MIVWWESKSLYISFASYLYRFNISIGSVQFSHIWMHCKIIIIISMQEYGEYRMKWSGLVVLVRLSEGITFFIDFIWCMKLSSSSVPVVACLLFSTPTQLWERLRLRSSAYVKSLRLRVPSLWSQDLGLIRI